MSFIKFGVLLTGVIFMIGCNSENQKTDIVNHGPKKELPQITAKGIQDLKVTDYVLSSKAEKETKNWAKFHELTVQIDFLKKADLSFFKNDKKELETFIKEFKNEIPQKVKTDAIQARILVLQTKSLKFNNLINLENIEIEAQLQGIKEVLEAQSNLILQINKKFELESQNIENPN